MLFELKKGRISEANIQAEIYHQLKILNIPCYLEYKVPKCRLDIIILKKLGDAMEIIAIIEVKSKGDKTADIIKTSGSQYKRYAAIGLPLIYCTQMSRVHDTVNKIIQIYYSHI